MDQFGEAGASVYGCRGWERTSTDWVTESEFGWVFSWINGKKVFEIPIKVLCGGSWFDRAENVHAGVTRHQFTPVRGSSDSGFRCVR